MSSYNEIFGGFLNAIDSDKADSKVKKKNITWYMSNGEEEIERNFDVTYVLLEDDIELLEVFDTDEQEDMSIFLDGFQHNHKFIKEVMEA